LELTVEMEAGASRFLWAVGVALISIQFLFFLFVKEREREIVNSQLSLTFAIDKAK